MLIRKTGLILSLLIFAIQLNFSQVNVRLFYGMEVNSVLLRVLSGSYKIQESPGSYREIIKEEIVFVAKSGDKVYISFRSGPGFLSDELRLLAGTDSSILSIKIIPGNKEPYEYEGDFSVFNSLGSLRIINNIDMEKYLAGVVQAEGGYKGHPEYFKSQAVIARTYAYLHLDRHSEDGYNLCDEVHCQVYHGRSVTKAIYEAVSATENIVLADNDSVLILTPFHSNCGGETETSENVWLTGAPYLKSVIDPYCGYSRNARWDMEIRFDEWLAYLKSKGYTGEASAALSDFSQDTRKTDFVIGDFSLPLTTIREDWGLRSAFFSMFVSGDKLIMKGKGYGHGVGLCQEGAMVMALRGFSHKQILNYYYSGVKLFDIYDVIIPKREKVTF